MQSCMIIQWEPSYKHESFLCICFSFGPQTELQLLYRKRELIPRLNPYFTRSRRYTVSLDFRTYGAIQCKNDSPYSHCVVTRAIWAKLQPHTNLLLVVQYNKMKLKWKTHLLCKTWKTIFEKKWPIFQVKSSIVCPVILYEGVRHAQK